MSARIRTIIVTLETSVRDDYVDEQLIPAIKLFAGVLKVDREVADAQTYFALENARRELGQKIWEVLYPSSA